MNNNIKFLEKDISKWWKGIAACFIMIGHILPDNTPMWLSYFFTGSIWVGLFFSTRVMECKLHLIIMIGI